MKLTLTSDIHLEFRGSKLLLDNDASVLIIPGDILTAKNFDPRNIDTAKNEKYLSALAEWSKRYDAIYYTAGNHEHYGYNIDRSHAMIADTVKQFPNIHYMNDTAIELNDEWVLLGTTLWTSAKNADPIVVTDLRWGMNDFHVIAKATQYGFEEIFTPMDMYDIHNNSMKWMKSQLEKYKDKKVMIMTHHAPSYESIQGGYRSHINGNMNHGYYTDLESFILDNQHIKYWFHGHTHASSDYMVGETRVLANAQGYPVEPNPNFNPKFVLEI